MAGSVTIQGQLPGTTSGTQYINLTIPANAGGNFESQEINLASGANTITIPPWAFMVIIIPNSNNTVPLTLQGVSGDTGIDIDFNGPTLLNMPSGTRSSSFVVTAASLTNTYTTIIFC